LFIFQSISLKKNKTLLEIKKKKKRNLTVGHIHTIKKGPSCLLVFLHEKKSMKIMILRCFELLSSFLRFIWYYLDKKIMCMPGLPDQVHLSFFIPFLLFLKLIKLIFFNKVIDFFTFLLLLYDTLKRLIWLISYFFSLIFYIN
jgi:hypothetical protein